jgi:hypothetical protein
MDAHTVGVVLLGGAGLAMVVWVLHKSGKVLVAVRSARRGGRGISGALGTGQGRRVAGQAGGDPLADQPGCDRVGRVAAVVGLAVSGYHPRCDRPAAHGVAPG